MIDPRWLWVAWLAAFVVIELALYWRYGTPGTLSGTIWAWLDGQPGEERGRRWRWLALAAGLAVLGWHLLAGAW